VQFPFDSEYLPFPLRHPRGGPAEDGRHDEQNGRGYDVAMNDPHPVESLRNRRQRTRERLRAEFIVAAESAWRRRRGRPMTADELRRMLRKYPGDR
jgi:hypothetical protein